MLTIELSSRLTDRERLTIVRYLTEQGRMKALDWLVALDAFDHLGSSLVVIDGSRETFATVYQRLVEGAYAEDFLEQLLACGDDDLESEGERLRAGFARRIAPNLAGRGYYSHSVVESRYLLAYCYYWWDSFAKGYAFEAQVFRDLARSGIIFTAHDIQKASDRMSRSDLIVLNREGDIKRSTYFLVTTRRQSLSHDFYIVRLYDARERRYRMAVLLTEETWREIDGDVDAATLEEAAALFPRTLRIRYNRVVWIVADYDVWKHQVKSRQGGNHDWETA